MRGTDLSLIVFGPVVLGIGLFFARPTDRRALMDWALVSCLVPFMYSLSLLWTYNPHGPAIQCMTPLHFRNWISISGRLNIQYYMGIDGLSLPLVLLTTFLTPIAIFTTRNATWRSYREFLFAILALETCAIGCFVALDLILFHIFWVAVLIPAFFIISLWGGGNRIRSATKFALLSMFGSALMLAGILALCSLSETRTFNLPQLYNDSGVASLPAGAQAWLFWAFLIPFAISAAIFPLHTWLPDACADAPTAGNILVTAVLTKLGAYGMLRICLPMFPAASAHFAPVLCVFAVLTILYGAWVAIAQRDIRRLLAYSTISHMGLIVLGIFALTANSITGAALHMVNHGLVIASLFVAAAILRARTGTWRMENLGGLIGSMPILGAVMLILVFAYIGLPPLSLFVSEFLLLMGAFEAGVGSSLLMTLGAFAVTGIIWWAVAMLSMYQRVMLGKPSRPPSANIRDIGLAEILVFVPLIALIIWIGLSSAPITNRMEPSVLRTLDLAAREIPAAVENESALPVPRSLVTPDSSTGPDALRPFADEGGGTE